MGGVGVVAALLATGHRVSVIVLIGVVMLAGIVVKNAIVLIDHVNQRRREGLSKHDALVEAGRVRLRPILMTTLTTILGLIPMALGLGEGAEIRAPDGRHRHRRPHRLDRADAHRDPDDVLRPRPEDATRPPRRRRSRPCGSPSCPSTVR